MDFELRPKFNPQDICDEFGINIEDFLSLIEGKKKINDEYTILFIIKEYIDVLAKNKRKSENTIKYYTTILQSFGRFLKDNYSDKKLFDLNDDLLYEFLRTCRPKKGDNLTPKTKNTYQAIIKNLFEFAYTRKYISEDLRHRFEHWADDLKPRYLPDQYIEPLLSTAKASSWPFLNWSIIYFMLTTGCRISETVRLRICDFNITENIIFIRKSKNNTERYVPMYPEVKIAMLDYLARTGIYEWDVRNQDPFFTKRCYDVRHPLSIRNVQYWMDKIYTKVGIKGYYTVHSMRHTFAVNCIKEGMPIEILQQVLGHKSIETTRIYVQMLPIDLKNEVTKKYPFPYEKLMRHLMGIGEPK